MKSSFTERLTLQLRSFNICSSIIFSYIRKVLKKESELEYEAGVILSVNKKETLSYVGLSSISQLLKRYKNYFFEVFSSELSEKWIEYPVFLCQIFKWSSVAIEIR